jgi:hypothetical protein
VKLASGVDGRWALKLNRCYGGKQFMTTLRKQLGVRYALIVGLCVFLVAALACYEFIFEPHLLWKLSARIPEAFACGMIVLTLAAGWLVLRRSLTPVTRLTRAMERITTRHLDEPLSRTHNGDEVDRLAAAINAMMARREEASGQSSACGVSSGALAKGCRYIVVSPPRSGTSSACRMAKMCGLKFIHAPSYSIFKCIDDYDFFADTPCYNPLVVMCLSQVRQIKCIYLDRDPGKLYHSWKERGLVRVYNDHDCNETNTDRVLNNMAFSDLFLGNKLTDQNYEALFLGHKRRMLETLEKLQVPCLVYTFDQGWEPFSRFIERPVPQEPLPNLNAKKIGDVI